MKPLTDDQRARARALLEERSIPVPFCGCRLYLGCERSSGYGGLRFLGAQWDAHRLAFAAWVGPIPPKVVVMHRCDVGVCIERTHLALGTQHDNLVDAAIKRRLPFRVLTIERARAIRTARALGHSLSELADSFGCSQSLVWKILTGELWSHE